MTIEIIKEALIKTIDIYALPSNWRTVEAYADLQEIGSLWYNSLESLTLEVPSVIIAQERNYIINTKHPDFKNDV